MTYTPTEWNCGDALTAEKMNKIERGVSDMNGEYTPNEWSCGDTITAEKLNHIEQGIADSGGSSDFSTAEVTVSNQDGVMFLLSTVTDDGREGASFSFPLVDVSYGTVQAVLYKGTAYGLILVESINVTTTGAAEYNESDGILIITGDCTITIIGR